MTNQIKIDEKWNEKIRKLAKEFNNFAKLGSLRRISYLIDKTFDILSDDKDPNQYDAAKMLGVIRAFNPKLISSYMSTLIDAKVEKSYFESKDYITPDYLKYPISEKSEDDIIILNVQDGEKSEKEQDKKEGNVDFEGKDMLINWPLLELIKFKIIKNLTKITYDEIDSELKKCACADGLFDKNSIDIWVCTECGAPYHENCAKLVALLEGDCRICNSTFLEEKIKVEEANRENH
ncbi:MAG: hypothetical protein ACTSPD_02275 [Promethearchaeota archaeon]